jgi:DNA-binding transcriptional LysR family regulator
VKFCRIGADTLAVIARCDHPAVRGVIDLDTYLAQKHVLVTSRVQGQGFEDIELHKLGVQRHIALRCQFYFAACRAVATTDMLLTMPESYARVLSQQFGHQVLSFPVPLAPLDAYMYWHASTDEEEAGMWLREKVRQSYAARYGQESLMAGYAKDESTYCFASDTA